MTFWTLIIGGILAMLRGLITGVFPDHATIGLTAKVLELMSSSLGLVMTIALSNFDMTLPFTIFGLMFLLENVRTIYIVWLRIKHLVL
jgi:hypothetical protein